MSVRDVLLVASTLAGTTPSRRRTTMVLSTALVRWATAQGTRTELFHLWQPRSFWMGSLLG